MIHLFLKNFQLQIVELFVLVITGFGFAVTCNVADFLLKQLFESLAITYKDLDVLSVFNVYFSLASSFLIPPQKAGPPTLKQIESVEKHNSLFTT
jgi:hypothetical protein